MLPLKSQGYLALERFQVEIPLIGQSQSPGQSTHDKLFSKSFGGGVISLWFSGFSEGQALYWHNVLKTQLEIKKATQQNILWLSLN